MDRIRPYIRLIGIALTILCLVFVLRRLTGLDATSLHRLLERDVGLTALAGIPVWLVVHALLGFTWWRLLRFVGVKSDLASSYKVALQSQLAKYLPGNVFHLAGSVAMMKLRGHSAKKATLAVTLQTGLMVATAACVGVPIFLRSADAIIITSATLLILILLVGGAAVYFGRFLQTKASPLQIVGDAASMVGATAGLLLLSGGYVAVLVHSLLGAEAAPPLADILAAFSVSWLAGFVAVGSPGGVGVREYVFGTLLQGNWDANVLTLAIVVFRFVTIAADIIAFALSFFISEQDTAHAAKSRSLIDP